MVRIQLDSFTVLHVNYHRIIFPGLLAHYFVIVLCSNVILSSALYCLSWGSFPPQGSLSVLVVHFLWKPPADLSASHALSQRVKSHWPGQQGCFTGLRALRREAICLHQPPQPNAWGIQPLACTPTRAPSLSLFFLLLCEALASAILCPFIKKLNNKKYTSFFLAWLD